MTQKSGSFLDRYKDSFNETMSQLNKLLKNLNEEYELTKNNLAKKYAEELKKAIDEINSTVKNGKVLTTEEEKVLVNYIDEVLEKYSGLYQNILAREALKRYASQSENEFEEIPLWEESEPNQTIEYREVEYYETLPEYSNGDSLKENLNPNLSNEEEKTLEKD